MIGLSIVNRLSKSRSDSPCGCSVSGWSLNRSTTLTNRIFRSGNSCRSMSIAASASFVGMSPAQAITTSGSCPWSVLAFAQMPSPLVQWAIASSMLRYCRWFCLSDTITLM